jgi:DNA repair protein RecO (recombination protein O)
LSLYGKNDTVPYQAQLLGPTMRPTHDTEAIVLRSRPFGESDKIVSFLTQSYGKISGIAKGASRSRKRFVNSLEPISLVNLRFQERPNAGLVFILGSDLVFGFPRLTTSLERISHASYLVEITDGLTVERDDNLALFEHLKNGLYGLEAHGASLRFLTAFELKLLQLAGYQPVLDCCKRCGLNRRQGGAQRWHASPADGGLLCEACARAHKGVLPLGATAVEILTALQSGSQALPTSLFLPFSVIEEIRAAALRFIQFHIDREIKSASFLCQFSTV